MEFYGTIEAAVVQAAQVTDVAMPKRVSFPSIFPPAVPSSTVTATRAVLRQLRRPVVFIYRNKQLKLPSEG